MTSMYQSTIAQHGDTGVLTVCGETDLATAMQLKSDIDETMSLTSGNVIVDLSDLDFIDSTGLGLLIGAMRKMTCERRSLTLVVTRPHVLRVFSLTGLDSVFSIVSDADEALRRSASTFHLTARKHDTRRMLRSDSAPPLTASRRLRPLPAQVMRRKTARG